MAIRTTYDEICVKITIICIESKQYYSHKTKYELKNVKIL